MSLLSSVLGAVTGKGDGTEASPLVAILGGLLAESGGLQGLMAKFSQAGMGDVFQKWVSTGPNPPISADQVQQVLGCEQIQALAAKLGIDPTRASEVLAEHLPGVVDKLTPQGKIEPGADTHAGLASMLPGLLAAITKPGSSTQQ
jgi:uncharacterized protein YidB (DUF937 family)